MILVLMVLAAIPRFAGKREGRRQCNPLTRDAIFSCTQTERERGADDRVGLRFPANRELLRTFIGWGFSCNISTVGVMFLSRRSYQGLWIHHCGLNVPSFSSPPSTHSRLLLNASHSFPWCTKTLCGHPYKIKKRTGAIELMISSAKYLRLSVRNGALYLKKASLTGTK